MCIFVVAFVGLSCDGDSGRGSSSSAPEKATSYTVASPDASYVPLSESQQQRAIEVATTSASVLALLDGREAAAERVNSSGVTRWAQVYVSLTAGRAVLTGPWPHIVVENPAACESCALEDGPLRYHFETEQASHDVDGILVNVDPVTWDVREILPDPPANAPPAAPARPEK